MKVLLVEDDYLLGKSIQQFLLQQEVTVTWLDDDRKVLPLLELSEFDVIILDLMLRYCPGEELLVKIRDKTTTPVIILTAKREFASKKKCFTSGADDYLTKPFEPEELLLRLQALSKRRRIANVVDLGEVKINLDQKTIINQDGQSFTCSQKTWDLLFLLAKEKNKVVSKERILNYVWGDNVVGDEIIRTYIKKLRKLLPAQTIETVKSVGYRLKVPDEN